MKNLKKWSFKKLQKGDITEPWRIEQGLKNPFFQDKLMKELVEERRILTMDEVLLINEQIMK